MRQEEFLTCVIQVCEQYSGSVTSWHRSREHNRRVGGASNSQHLGWRAVDIVLEDWTCKRVVIEKLEGWGLFVLDEVTKKNHLHVDDRHNAVYGAGSTR
jgi:hypothetical protein